MPGVVIAGTHSGCGKTTVTLGLLAALTRKGLRVQPFKTGPDFIDPGLHRVVTGRPSRNLDIWMCGEDEVLRCFRHHAADADMAVVEGVMGMYDGNPATAELAAFLGLPVVLVVDAYGMAESAGAVVHGFTTHKTARNDRRPSLAGVIFNRVASESHFERLKESVREIPVLGYLPRDLRFEIPHRHLGLMVAEESPLATDDINRLADAVMEHIDVDKIAQMSKKEVTPPILPLEKGRSEEGLSQYSTCRIAVAYDKAFCFYYEDNLDALREAGADIVTFSPVSDTTIPDADGIYLGGGYPELYAQELSANSSLRNALHAWCVEDKPLYAECGGMMYLSQGIYDFEGRLFPMAGVFPFQTRMKEGRAHLGYREIEFREDCLLAAEGLKCRGHEFHYSEIVAGSHPLTTTYAVRDRAGQDLPGEGYRTHNTLASYIHVHFRSNPALAGNLVQFMKESKRVYGEHSSYRTRQSEERRK